MIYIIKIDARYYAKIN